MNEENKQSRSTSTTTTTSTTMSKGMTSRCIFNDDDMESWKNSPLKADLLRVVSAMGKSCAAANNPTTTGTNSGYYYDPNDPLKGLSPAMASLHGSLTQMLRWCEEDFPPIQQSGPTRLSIRFGNPAFRDWHQRLVKDCAFGIVKQMYLAHKQQSLLLAAAKDDNSESAIVVKTAAENGALAATVTTTKDDKNEQGEAIDDAADQEEALLELASYLHDAFGHPIRLDYGTGHESSFMIVLYCACKLGWMDTTAARGKQPPSMDKLKATTIAIFHAYLKVTRQIQYQYRLEPAGSHGVWGLDDYHCLPFYFGACQCSQSQTLAPSGEGMPTPSDITDEAMRKQYASTLLYFGCMDYICTLKSGAPLFECSPMLYDISQTCPNWTKVAAGLIKLYEGEVLNKRQVVQHFTFGRHLFVATWEPSGTAPAEPPEAGFRDSPVAVAPMVRAPWARENNNSVPMGVAPWATGGASGGGSNPPPPPAGMMPPTKAPWAK